MYPLSIRLTDHRSGFDQTLQLTPHLDGELIASQVLQISPGNDDLVPAEPHEMAEALTQISTELGCANTLDDMLHAIDALRGGRPAGPRFVDNGDGTITDTVNRLMWSKLTNTSKNVNHAMAEATCADLSLAGHTDWRLPTRAELLTLVDDTRCSPAIDTDAFPDTKNDWYWTSTLRASASSYAWFVYFDFGGANADPRGYSYAFVRAVRSLPAGQ
ncbi:Lcl C-terminal domain-containing protein [Lysobacter olei]